MTNITEHEWKVEKYYDNILELEKYEIFVDNKSETYIGKVNPDNPNKENIAHLISTAPKLKKENKQLKKLLN